MMCSPVSSFHGDLADVGPVDLGLLAGERLGAEVHLATRLGADLGHVLAQRADRAGVSALGDHVVQPRGAQSRVARQGFGGLGDERAVRVDEARPRRTAWACVPEAEHAAATSGWTPSWATIVPTSSRGAASRFRAGTGTWNASRSASPAGISRRPPRRRADGRGALPALSAGQDPERERPAPPARPDLGGASLRGAGDWPAAAPRAVAREAGVHRAAARVPHQG